MYTPFLETLHCGNKLNALVTARRTADHDYPGLALLELLELLAGLLLDRLDGDRDRQGDGRLVVAGGVEVEVASDVRVPLWVDVGGVDDVGLVRRGVVVVTHRHDRVGLEPKKHRRDANTKLFDGFGVRKLRQCIGPLTCRRSCGPCRL